MEIDCVQLGSNMEDNQDEYVDHSFSPCSCERGDVFGDPEVLPHVGEEYQAEIPPLIAECDRLLLINAPNNSEFMDCIHKSFSLGLSIPLMWSNTGIQNVNGTEEFENSEESQINSNNECHELRVETVVTLSVHDKKMVVCSNMQHPAGIKKMEADLVLPQESENKMDQRKRGFCPLPGSLGESWTDVECDSFLLALYIFGKNFVAVKKFIESKETGDILSFYYGKFYRSDKYRKWAECRKLRSRRSIHGQKIFTGWRQQELLSRLFAHVSQECQSLLLEVSRAFAERKISFEEYIFSLKSAVGMEVLIGAVGIGRGKHDLTGIAMEPVKPNHTISIHSEIPIGRACSTLTSADIIKFLTGDFRLSKARSSDLFWEAVWPRLLARGWHSEQPKDNGFSSSKQSLVFLIPGVKRFSRRRQVKGNHYFDSVSDVLNKVASDPGLLELEIEAAKGSQHKEDHGWDPPLKQDQDGLSNKKHHCYLQPPTSKHNRDVQKFTIVDTSLAYRAGQPKVRELRSLPVETTSMSTSSSLSETEKDTCEDSQENAEEISTLKPAEEVTGGTICVTSSYCSNNCLNTGIYNNSDPKIAVDEIEKRSLINDRKDRTMKYQFSRKVKSGCSKYLVPTTKQQGATGESNCSTKNMLADRKSNEDESHYMSNTPDGCVDMDFQEAPPHNMSSASSLVKDSPVESNEGIAVENCVGREVYPEKTQSPKLIDLNIPQTSPQIAADEPSVTDVDQNNDSYENHSFFLSGTVQQSEPFNLPEAGAHPGEEPLINSRRQSTRNRPLTMKALEALEQGFLSTKKKRKVSEGNSISESFRRVRGKLIKATSMDGVANGVSDSRTGEFWDGFCDDSDIIT